MNGARTMPERNPASTGYLHPGTDLVPWRAPEGTYPGWNLQPARVRLCFTLVWNQTKAKR
jgi:hypothetical protein